MAVVFLLIGLWHGAHWTFIIWGALHATFMIGYLVTDRARAMVVSALPPAGQALLKGLGWLLTFALVSLAWVFFRAATVGDALLILRRIVTGMGPGHGIDFHPGLDSVQFAIALGLIAALFVADPISIRTPWRVILAARPRLQRWSAYYAFAVVFLLLVLWSPERSPQPFIYFQF